MRSGSHRGSAQQSRFAPGCVRPADREGSGAQGTAETRTQPTSRETPARSREKWRDFRLASLVTYHVACVATRCTRHYVVSLRRSMGVFNVG